MNNIFIKILKLILKQLARLMIWRFKPQVIAITGSAGKTSTKEAIYAVLTHSTASGQEIHKQVRKSEGNLNNELGVPLTIIGDWPKEKLKLVSRDTPPGEKKLKKLFFWGEVILSALIRFVNPRKSAYPQTLILEYGADRPGDIKELLSIARPYIGIITALDQIPVHVEFFSGPEAVMKEKIKLVEALPANGFAILNSDNEIVMNVKERTRARVVTFGFNEGADMKISNLENRSQSSGQEETPAGISFKIGYGGSFVPVLLKNAFGRAQAYAAAIGACVGLIYDLNLVEIAEALAENYSPPKGRMNLLKGIKGAYVIDDTYNASPISMQEALETLVKLPAKRKITVLGDMLELGKYSIEAHEGVGRAVSKIADILITVGPRAKFIAESARKTGMDKHKILSFDTAGEAGMAVQNLMKTGDLILVKASRVVGLDKIVEEIEELV